MDVASDRPCAIARLIASCVALLHAIVNGGASLSLDTRTAWPSP
jgi:hypothetical protein